MAHVITPESIEHFERTEGAIELHLNTPDGLWGLLCGSLLFAQAVSPTSVNRLDFSSQGRLRFTRATLTKPEPLQARIDVTRLLYAPNWVITLSWTADRVGLEASAVVNGELWPAPDHPGRPADR